MFTTKNKVADALIGMAVGDALGVPVEFKTRAELDANPVKEMRSYGTYNQPAGTWSDDSSLAFCLAESLIDGYRLEDIAQRFVNWKYKFIWTPRGDLFDIGNQTSKAIKNLKALLRENELKQLTLLKYDTDEWNNGNGSLMRIIPLLFYIKGMPIQQQFEIIRDVSALTHGHIRSAIACLIYLKMAEYILERNSLSICYLEMRKDVATFLTEAEITQQEQQHFDQVLIKNIASLKRPDINSGGYVIESLEAAFWCLLTSQSYEETVLKAVNLGQDTDTTAAIVGGLAGLCYGIENISDYWIADLARMEDIFTLSDQLNAVYCS